MRGRFARLPLGCAVVAAACVFAAVLSRPTPADDPKPAAEFGTTKVWSIHLEVPANEFDAMQPAPPTFPGGPPPAPKKKDNKKRDSEKNLFGTEFPWVEADVTVDGKPIKKVGLRYSGDITYFASGLALKRP